MGSRDGEIDASIRRADRKTLKNCGNECSHFGIKFDSRDGAPVGRLDPELRWASNFTDRVAQHTVNNNRRDLLFRRTPEDWDPSVRCHWMPGRSRHESKLVDDLGVYGLHITAVEVLRFATESEVARITVLAGGARPEVAAGIAALHFSVNDHEPAVISAFTSRAEQGVHDLVRELLGPVGTFRRERPGDLMLASELPFVFVSAISPTGDSWYERVCAALGRDAEEPGRAGAWWMKVWPDLAIVAAEHDTHSSFRLGHKTHAVSHSVMLDAALLRSAQREVLESLARRAANGTQIAERNLSALHQLSVSFRSRLWWPQVSQFAPVQTLADALDKAWGLGQLAEGTHLELGSLAEQARQHNDELVAGLLFVLTAASVGLTFAALVVGIVTSSELLGAAPSGLAPTLIVFSVATLFYRRLQRRG